MAGKHRDQHEFKPLLVEIEEEPLNPLGRTVFWVIVFALAFLSLWMVFGRIDVVVSARGKVIPYGEVKIVQPLTTGVLRKILVREGQLLEQGQVLMEIDPSDTEPELASMKSDLQQAELEMLRIDALLSGRSFNPPGQKYDAEQTRIQQRLYSSCRDRLARKLEVQDEELSQAEQRLAAERKGYEQIAYLLDASRQRLDRLEEVRDLVSRDDYDQLRTDVVRYGSQLDSSKHKIEELQFRLGQIRQEIRLIEEENRVELLDELARKRQEFLYLQAKIQRTEFVNTRQQIRSPVRGYVSQLLVHTVGGVVIPAEKLAMIVPADSRLVIKAQVLNKDVGYVAPGMDVALKVDTFEFQKYGLVEGKLLQVARDSIDDEKFGPVYEAYIEPQQTTLIVEGTETSITTGMTVTAEVKVGKRRIIEFFIYPLIKYLNEGTSVR